MGKRVSREAAIPWLKAIVTRSAGNGQSRDCQSRTRELLAPWTQIATDCLAFLEPDCQTTISETTELSEAVKWPRGFTIQRRIDTDRPLWARIRVSYTYENPRDGEGYSCSIRFFTTDKGVKEVASISVSTWCGYSRPVYFTSRHLTKDTLEKLVEITKTGVV